MLNAWRILLLPVLSGLCFGGEMSMNGDFEQGTAGWTLGKEMRVERGVGRSGTHGLSVTRDDVRKYEMASIPVPVVPGKFYRVGVWVKTQDVVASTQGGGATLAIEYSKAGADGKPEFLTGRYLKGVVGTQDWTLVSDEVRIPSNAIGASLVLYLWKGASGKAWFDDLSIRAADVNLWTAYSLNPGETVTDGTYRVAVAFDGGAAKGAAAVQLLLPGYDRIVELKAGQGEFELGALSDGRYSGELRILDAAGKTLDAKKVPVTIARNARRQVAIDRVGRTLIAGKPFMPIGIFCTGLDGEMIDRFAEAGLNCALPYSSMALGSVKGKAHELSQLREVLDLAEKSGLKVIFSCKDVGSSARHGLQKWHGAEGQEAIVQKVTALLKDHPALLAWYINDEQPLSQIERLTRMRRQFNQLDGDHPTVGTLYQYEDLPNYGPTCDIMGVDPYPLHGKDMKIAVTAMKQLHLTGLPRWVVPQICNLKVYYDSGKVTTPNPTLEAMRSLVLLEAAYGAKGFLFYKYEDLKSWKLPKENFAGEWAKVKALASMLRELEPYIMSGHPIELLSEGAVVAARLRNDAGKSVILIAGVGPGEAELTLPLTGRFRSRFGRTVPQGEAWLFRGTDICSDLLFEE